MSRHARPKAHPTLLSAIARTARSNAKFDRLIELSAEGLSREDAAASVGLSIHGMISLMVRKGVGKAWPIDPDKL